ncbi:MAG: hypothetical protein KDB14_07645 [Planctomycetales bacterium]|nr:hypothetical protein [Planctomycetales bacterium]
MAATHRFILATLMAAIAVMAAGCPSRGTSDSDVSLESLVDEGEGPPLAPVITPAPAPIIDSTPSTESTRAPRGRATVALLDPKRTAGGPVGPPTQVSPGAAPAGLTQPAPEGEVAEQAKQREPLFVDWGKPKLAFAITGQQHGYLEPCGCTGLANQKGGMARRHTLFKDLRSRGWTLVPLDVGGQVRRPGPQAESKFKWTTEALFKLDYKAVTYGADDLMLSSGELAFPMLNSPESPYPFICSNVSVISSTPTHRVLEAGGLRIGITAVLGDEEIKSLKNNPGVEWRSVDAGLKDAWTKLSAQNCNFYVLMAHASVNESREIARRFPHFHLVVTTGLGEPEQLPERIQVAKDKVTMMIQAGNKAMYAGVLALYDSKPQVRYQRVPLDDRFEDSPEMLKVLRDYQAELKERGLKQLGAIEVPHFSGNKFVGSEACKDCHSKAFKKWATTGHAHATDSIVNPKERAGIQRHFDPECLSCHVTGWAPQDYTPYVSGYASLESTAHLKQNGCENCHGPGQRHVDIENGDLNVSEADQQEARKQLQLPYARAKEQCIMCHDQDNSPDFFKDGAFERYYEKIKHVGKD